MVKKPFKRIWVVITAAFRWQRQILNTVSVNTENELGKIIFQADIDKVLNRKRKLLFIIKLEVHVHLDT